MGKRLTAMAVALVSLAVLVVFANCVFGPNRYYGVMSHRGNRVFIQHDRWYYVGRLPEGWETLKTGVRSASWYNEEFQSTISTSVLCQTSVGDSPLTSVAAEVAAAVEGRAVSDERTFMLDGRGALRQTVNGIVDGVPVEMDVVVVKKNYCAFDFIAVGSPAAIADVRPVFEDFFNGFRFESTGI